MGITELKAAHRSCKDAVEQRRIQAVWLRFIPFVHTP